MPVTEVEVAIAEADDGELDGDAETVALPAVVDAPRAASFSCPAVMVTGM